MTTQDKSPRQNTARQRHNNNNDATQQRHTMQQPQNLLIGGVKNNWHILTQNWHVMTRNDSSTDRETAVRGRQTESEIKWENICNRHSIFLLCSQLMSCHDASVCCLLFYGHIFSFFLSLFVHLLFTLFFCLHLFLSFSYPSHNVWRFRGKYWNPWR